MEDQNYFVGIKQPVQVRKSLLECTKEVIRHLQKLEQIRPIREEKIKKILELKHIMEEVDKLNADLKAEFPKADLKFKPAETIPIKEKKDMPQIVTSKQATPQKIGKKEANELEKLEQELDLIENRLNRLSS